MTSPLTKHLRGLIIAVFAVFGTLGLIGGIGLVGLARSKPSTAQPGSERHSVPIMPAMSTPASPTNAITTTARTTTSSSSAGTSPTATSTAPVAPQKVPKLADNPIFADVGLAPVDCGLPRLTADPAAQAAFFQAGVDCLNRAWLPVLAAAGLPAGPPGLVMPTEPYRTPCGDKLPTANANYCEGVIYMPPRYFTEITRTPPSRPAVFLGVLAHEYGHHVQELAGVMDAAWSRRHEAGVDTPAGLEISRRNELGATCFGGMFFASVVGRGSVSPAMLNQAQQDASRRGDHPGRGLPLDHGTARNNGVWFGQGVRTNRASQCNTWHAPAESVS